MGPRKRAKPNPAEGSSTSLPTKMPSKSSTASQASSSASASANPATTHGTPAPSQQDEPTPLGDSTPKLSKQVHKTPSWYGSWPRAPKPKSTASTQVARETIQGGTLQPISTADFSRFDTKKSSDSASIKSTNQSLKSLRKIAENGSNTEGGEEEHSEGTQANIQETEGNGEPPKPNVPEGGTAQIEGEQQPLLPTSPQRPSTSSGWMGWIWSSSLPEQPQSTAPEPTPTERVDDEDKETAVAEPVAEPVTEPIVAPGAQPAPQDQPPPARDSSWFGLWSTRGADQTAVTKNPDTPAEPSQPAERANEPEDVVMEDAPPVQAPDAPPPNAGSTWAFWSRDPGPATGKKPAAREEGQLAVMGETSETQPRRSISMEVKGTPPKEPQLKTPGKDERSKIATPSAKESSSKKSKRVRPQSMDLDGPLSSRPSTPDSISRIEPSSSKAGPAKTPTSVKTTPPNLLLPSFRSTYRMKDNPSILKQIAQIVLRSQRPPSNHVFLAKEPPKIKRALAIGVHGLFPANYLRPMIGQPTGTSLKFANHCADAIRRWADSNGCEACEIEKVALEGEGRIGERVENLWKLLLNWIDQIRRADLIVLACHSQGVPVTIMLLAKLIELGIVIDARIGICAMAGVSLGPFPDYRSGMGILMGSAAELWEFSKPESEISKRLEESIKVVLNFGARITCIASIDDQVVPMESAVYSPANHPYIYRSVFIDGRIHAPDFIANLVGFALKLRNLGVSDHGLIRELSLPLAGSLYSGEGHSRLYDDEQVYDLAVVHALETTNVANASCDMQKFEGLAQQNPYHLPWIMRGLLEEDFVKTELNAETAELLRQFDDWKPVTKALKDVKYRLEAVRSKL